MTLRAEPVVSDPENDEVSVTVIVDGVEHLLPESGVLEIEFDEGIVGYEHEASVEFVLDDGAGNEVSEAFAHTVIFARRIRLDPIHLTMRGGSCFVDNDEVLVDIAFTIDGNQTLERTYPVITLENLEPRRMGGLDSVDRGEPVAETVHFDVEMTTVEGTFTDSFERTHTSSDDVLTNLFRFNTCFIQLNYSLLIEDL